MGRYEEAVNYFDRALDISLSEDRGVGGGAHSASILNNWGLALYEMGRYEEAINYFDRALKGAVQYSPEDVPSYIINLFNNKGAALSAQGRYPEAITHYNRVLALKPYDADALNNKGNALSSLGRYQEAAEQYDKALEALQNPNADEEAKIRSGSIQIDELNDYKELTKYVQFPTGDLKKGADNIQVSETTVYLDRYKEFNGLKYVTLSKDSEIVIFIQFNKGVNLYASKNYNDANNNFDKVLKINSGFPPGLYYKHLTLEKLGQTDKAEIFKQKFEGLNSNYKGEKLDTTLLNVPKVALEEMFVSQ